MSNGRGDQRGVADRREQNEDHAIGESVLRRVCDAQSQAGLVHTAAATQRDQAYIRAAQKLTQGRRLVFAPEQRRERNRHGRPRCGPAQQLSQRCVRHCAVFQ